MILSAGQNYRSFILISNLKLNNINGFIEIYIL